MATSCSLCKMGGAALRCTRCKVAHYCNKDCQSAHWKAHKPGCKPAEETNTPAAATTTVLPDPDHEHAKRCGMNFSSFDEAKRTFWRGWFLQKVPMLGDKTPAEASKTEAGRRELEELFALYESFENKGSSSSGAPQLDFNVPRDWARWRLKFPGTRQRGVRRFVEEEMIFCGDDSPALMEQIVWGQDPQGGQDICNWCLYEVGDDAPPLDKCGGCGKRQYCGRKCQVEDWKGGKHKLYCKKDGKSFDIWSRLSDTEKWILFKKSHEEQYAKYLLELTGGKRGSNLLPVPTWKLLLEQAVADRVIDRSVLEADLRGEAVGLSDELRLKLAKIVLRLQNLGQNLGIAPEQRDRIYKKMLDAETDYIGGAHSTKDGLRQAFGGKLTFIKRSPSGRLF